MFLTQVFHSYFIYQVQEECCKTILNFDESFRFCETFSCLCIAIRKQWDRRVIVMYINLIAIGYLKHYR